jgi:hypothetical protein
VREASRQGIHNPSFAAQRVLHSWSECHAHGAAQNRREQITKRIKIPGAPSFSPTGQGIITRHRPFALSPIR